MADRQSPEDRIRRTVHFSGRVQGVGFRYTTQAAASSFDVAGFVRNLRDGRVELVVEGSRAEVDRLQAAVERAMGGCIEQAHVKDAPPTGEFTSFQITF